MESKNIWLQYQLQLGDYNGKAADALADAHAPPGLFWAEMDGSRLGVKRGQIQHQLKDDGRCIRHSKSGWWFSKCDSGNLNGHYYDGVVWYTWHGWWYVIKSVGHDGTSH
ncbi:fibrinogen-like protein 1 isoform X2 [Micropterus dolomieu]|uniref:fibrinogen-like protein 1 isoform X2 n=1 Tax=Micropterus dolomieu TaxID=147949 RepID=UPI001E8EAD12|nr:fibrinogen-like protein 1 isoform X2 [Micropterus dolomieu]